MKSIDESYVFQIKITLVGSKPPIWRRFLIDPNENLFNLHLVIQILMGWTDSHLHQYIQGKTFFAMPDRSDEGSFGSERLDESKFKIFQVLDKPKAKIIYEYDFGDSWGHVLVLEKILPQEESKKYPVCLDGALACPPEDCGGIFAYRNILEIIGNPDHEDHEEMIEWLDDEFDPKEFHLSVINSRLQRMK